VSSLRRTSYHDGRLWQARLQRRSPWRRRRRRPAERPAGLPPPCHHVLHEDPAGGADERWTHLWRSVPCLDHDTEFRAAATTTAANSRTSSTTCCCSTTRRPWTRSGVLEVHPGIDSRDVRLLGLGACSRGLKRLHLSSVSLEDLELKSCTVTFREITSHTLKILTVDRCYFDIIPAADPRVIIIITVPALVSLDFTVGSAGSSAISIKEATNIVQADPTSTTICFTVCLV
jgi:hypothetical protein